MNYIRRYFTLPRNYVYLFYLLIFTLFILTFLEYKGQGYIYILFTIVSNALLYFGFRKNAIFFDTFIGVFLWLGFWFKLSFRVVFLEGQFNEKVGNFDGSGAAFDYALLVVSCGLFGFLIFSFIREKFVFTYPEKISDVADKGLCEFYENHRKYILSAFVFLFVIVAVSNVYYGIYQRGAIPRTILPYGLGGIYTWLLFFGLASVSALVLRYEFTLTKKTTYAVAIICLLESFISNVSLLSRGMIINTSALVYGVMKSLRIYNIKSSLRYLGSIFFVFLILFVSSVFLVNYMRTAAFQEKLGAYKSDEVYHDFFKSLAGNERTTRLIFIDRWVGMESVLAVSSYPARGWDLWKAAWGESLTYNKLSFYDEHLITSQYRNTDLTKHHYISVPGIIAFCFYPGSFFFLFICTFMLGAIATIIEISVYKLGGKNIILCALLAQVVAYRYAHFGYAPGRSYLLFGALYLNLILIYLSNIILTHWYKRERVIE